MIRDQHVFTRLEPPAHGLAKLRRRIAEADRGRRRWPLVIAPAALAAVVVLAMALWPTMSSTAAAPPLDRFADDPTLIAWGVVDGSAEPVSVPRSQQHDLAVHRVPVADDSVVFYWVSTTRNDEAAAAEH